MKPAPLQYWDQNVAGFARAMSLTVMRERGTDPLSSLKLHNNFLGMSYIHQHLIQTTFGDAGPVVTLMGMNDIACKSEQSIMLIIQSHPLLYSGTFSARKEKLALKDEAAVRLKMNQTFPF